jgi:hypothetical protein
MWRLKGELFLSLPFPDILPGDRLMQITEDYGSV